MTNQPLIQVNNLEKRFASTRSKTDIVYAVCGVSFDVNAGETLGLVGESGSGKSTTARMVAGLLPATAGSIKLFGTEITGAKNRRNLAVVRHQMQFVFQDPNGSLNPRMRVGDSIAEPLDVEGQVSSRERHQRVSDLLETVGLPASYADRYPHEFSGGQKQRIGIARALALRPKIVLCDEPVSALDVSMQAQIVNLLLDLQDRFQLSYLFIAHDLAIVRSISTRVAVMYLGRIVEIAPKGSLYRIPQHPYTRILLEAVPRPIPGRRARSLLQGELSPSLSATGCAFRARCPHAFDRCAQETPALRQVSDGHLCACHLAAD